VTGFLDEVRYPSLPRTADLIAPRDPIEEYFNDFSIDSLMDDFIGESFRVREAAGFPNAAIHSPHDYSDGVSITYQLKTPVRILEDQMLEYRDIALVEPGRANSVFGDDNFFDFVVVEGSKDGIDWTPLFDGYDATSDPGWLRLYTESRSPNLSHFEKHEVSTSEVFDIGDVIFIRFRLFADAFVNGWGWIIDDVEISMPSNVTTPVFDINYESIAIYPNPTSDLLQIDLPSGSSDRRMRLHDLRGSTVISETVGSSSASHSWSINHLPEGIYILEISEDNRITVVEKIVVSAR